MTKTISVLALMNPILALDLERGAKAVRDEAERDDALMREPYTDQEGTTALSTIFTGLSTMDALDMWKRCSPVEKYNWILIYRKENSSGY